MPDGKTHDLINATVLIIVLSGLYYLGKERTIDLSYLNMPIILAFSTAYLFATFFLSPDLDINSKPYKRWGILRIIWWPYKVVFKHRGLSHHPVVGPLSIVMNLAIIVASLLLLAGFELHKIPGTFIIAVTTGMIMSMEVHIISDCLISKLKSIF
ncbi:metal-binding protein [Methanolobus psychrotolerans]|uniref:metal-binding protein n=1 Tax=Methanolobus psychrotolerans TaxID=1874706 RepID=UPI000B9186D1|nr:metal-binding protein [Methanolobus psychrotolerans]